MTFTVRAITFLAALAGGTLLVVFTGPLDQVRRDGLNLVSGANLALTYALMFIVAELVVPRKSRGG